MKNRVVLRCDYSCHVYECDVIGTERFWNVTDFTSVLPVFVPVARRFLKMNFVFHMFVQCHCTGYRAFMGIAQDKLSKTGTLFFARRLEAPTQVWSPLPYIIIALLCNFFLPHGRNKPCFHFFFISFHFMYTQEPAVGSLWRIDYTDTIAWR